MSVPRNIPRHARRNESGQQITFPGMTAQKPPDVLHIRAALTDRKHDIAKAAIRLFASAYMPVAAAADLHLRELGSGCYALVYDHPLDDSKVIKVCFHSRKYLQYANHCQEIAATNPHVPKIDSIIPLKITNTDYNSDENAALIVMEKLQHESTCNAFHAFKRGKEMYPGNKAFNPLMHQLWQYVMTELAERGYTDLHEGNVMARKDGTPVLTDPVAG